MEIAFSVLPKDRKFILSQLLLLHQLRPDSKPINFAFLSRVMDILAIEVVYCKAVGLNFPFSSSKFYIILYIFNIGLINFDLCMFSVFKRNINIQVYNHVIVMLYKSFILN